MKFIYKIILVFLICAISGCSSLHESDNIHYFSIDDHSASTGKKDIISKDFTIQVMPFNSNGLYGTKMVFAQPPNSVFFDNYNCWAQRPSVMLSNFFTLYLCDRVTPKGKDIKNYMLTGTILKFDCNMKEKEAVFAVKLILKDSVGNLITSKVYKSNVRMNKLSASAFAQSMSEAVNNTAQDFFKKLNSFNQHILKQEKINGN